MAGGARGVSRSSRAFRRAKGPRSASRPSGTCAREEVPLPFCSYQADTDAYLFVLRTHRTPVSIRRQTVDAIVAAYSDEGGGMSLREVADHFKLTLDDLNEIRLALKLSHKSFPSSDETLRQTPEEDLIADDLARKRESVRLRAAERWWTTVKRDARRWQEFELGVLDPLREIWDRHDPASDHPPRLSLPLSNAPFALLIGAFDLHYGGTSWRDETGCHYDRAEARRRLEWALNRTLAEVAFRGRPQEIVLVCGGGWFHVDREGNCTTKGTVIDVDGTHTRMLQEGSDLAARQVEMLRQVAPVRVCIVQGNHDRASTALLATRLEWQFKADEQVTVDWTWEPRYYFEVGRSMICLYHGDLVRASDLPITMANERPEMWGRARWRLALTGHFHREKELPGERKGVTVVECPSLSGETNFEKRRALLSNAALRSIILDYELGRIGDIHVPWVEDGDGS